MRKQKTILEFILSKGIEGARYTEIVKLAYELSYGKGSYIPGHAVCRGYWSGAFVGRHATYAPWGGANHYYFHTPGMITRNTDLHNGKYFLNEIGMKKLEKLKSK